MIDDPIVASVHAIRDALAAAFNYDVHAIFEDLRRQEAASGKRLTPQPGRKTPDPDGLDSPTADDVPRKIATL